ncbi:TPA: hypothetical protein ACLKPX_004317 [Klebsiella pneumoniae]|uniref:hypothetical protein n=1 Tax=Klebsiella pneumoniae TaxID=573 RepID=UPI001FABE030|nr:hypothetical protein [Klebsiella pneumoniae]
MTKSTITRERLAKIKSWRETYGAGSNVMLPAEEAEELASIALAAMDSKPHTDDELSNLLWYSQEATCHSDPNYYCEFQRLATPGLIAGIIRELQERRKAAMDSKPVAYISKSDFDAGYPHILARRDFNKACTMAVYAAQPAPVVPEEKPIPNTLSMYAVDAVAAIAEVKGWNACRAAMLQELKKSAGTEATCRSNENVQVLHTKSPAQSDCCPAQNVVVPAQSPIDHGYLPECECSGCKATARICAELSANSSENPDCWCRTCRPVVLNDMRFVVCPDCGNKRCPRANDHRNACTGSNEPGQEGSAYPDTLQEPKP